MPDATPTRASLLIRIRDSGDSDAWCQFVEIYGPLVFRFAKRCGLQESDSADLVQDVMSEVTKSISRFDYDPQLGKFRSWLYRIAKRTVSRAQQKQKRQPAGAGGSDAFRLIEEQPDANNEVQAYWDREYQRHLLEWAAETVRPQFHSDTWQAFWLTSVQEISAGEVAQQLGMSVGSVYVAKSRVLKKLAQKIREVDEGQ